MAILGFNSNNPLLEYTIENLWGNPEENHQHQVKTVRISDYYGLVDNFKFMNKWRTLPKRDKLFHVFSVGGLDAGFWNFKTSILRRNPLDRWINFSDLCVRRGIQLDIYNTKGYQYSRSHAWMMATYDGILLIALEKTRTYPIPNDTEMFFRCYTASVAVARNDQVTLPNTNPYGYETMTYENASELAQFTARWQYYKNKAGYTFCYHNGAFWNGSPSAIPRLAVGDIVEIAHDPTVIRAEVYSYSTLPGFYSELDKVRKLILHPPKRPDFTFRYFDDNDYYLFGPTNYGLYFHRNGAQAVRQLTHADVAISDYDLQAASEYHPALDNLAQMKILVLIRKTDWEYQWPNDSQRIRYLYRLSDENILNAMTGDRSTVPEWQASNLESGHVMSFTRDQFNELDRDKAKLALGYNASTLVLSKSPLRAEYNPGSLGVEIPPTYRSKCSAWEYDEAGKLIDYYNVENGLYYSPRNEGCKLVEFVLGIAGRTLEYITTNQDVMVNPVHDFRVYVSAYSILTGELVGELTDVTGDTSVYEVVNNYIVWKGLDTVNQRAVVLFNTRSLAYTFELDHIDHSLSFAVTHIYEPGGLIFPISFANYDLFLNDHPLIDNVDWVFENQYFYIFNKQFIKPGAQKITFRAHQFHSDKTKPKQDTELGFVDGGVIGRFKRYNVRDDRVTRCVIGGALYPTEEVLGAETHAPNNLFNPLNGLPYMVKHVYCPIWYVEPYNNFPGFQLGREVDKRVSDYLTLYAPKPVAGSVMSNLQDKYRLFSPLMSVVVNALVQRLLILPELAGMEEGYTAQFVREQIAPYLWWLKYDPVTLKFDTRYFAIMPYANYETQVVTSDELVFLRQVNDLFLESTCKLEGHFEVNDYVR